MILKSELDEDIKKIINSLQSRDYYIPTIWMIFSPALKKLQPFYILVFISGVFSWFYHGPHELWSACAILIFSLIGVLVISFISIGVLYYPNLLLLCLDESIKNNSFLCNKLLLQIKRCALFVHVIGSVISIPFILMVNWGFLVPFGVYFFMILFSYGVIASTMSRYLTSEFISIIGNIKKNINSPSINS